MGLLKQVKQWFEQSAEKGHFMSEGADLDDQPAKPKKQTERLKAQPKKTQKRKPKGK